MPWPEYPPTRARRSLRLDLGRDHLLYRGDGGDERLRGRPGRCSRRSPGRRSARLGPSWRARPPPAGLIGKMTATIAEVSGGRFVSAPRRGWNEEEFRAFGLPFDHRVSRSRRRSASSACCGRAGHLAGATCRLRMPSSCPGRCAAPQDRQQRAAHACGDAPARACLEHVVRGLRTSPDAFATLNEHQRGGDAAEEAGDIERSACDLRLDGSTASARPRRTPAAGRGVAGPDRLGAAGAARRRDEIILVVDPVTGHSRSAGSARSWPSSQADSRAELDRRYRDARRKRDAYCPPRRRRAPPRPALRWTPTGSGRASMRWPTGSRSAAAVLAERLLPGRRTPVLRSRTRRARTRGEDRQERAPADGAADAGAPCRGRRRLPRRAGRGGGRADRDHGNCMGVRLGIRIAAASRAGGGAGRFHGGGLVTDDPKSPHRSAGALRAEIYLGHADQDPSNSAQQIAETRRCARRRSPIAPSSIRRPPRLHDVRHARVRRAGNRTPLHRAVRAAGPHDRQIGNEAAQRGPRRAPAPPRGSRPAGGRGARPGRGSASDARSRPPSRASPRRARSSSSRRPARCRR